MSSTKTQTLYGPVDSEILEIASKIKLLVCDVDGVFSDGRIYLGNDGEELKTFNTKDGFGVKAVQKAGVEVAVITGRRSNIVHNRMTALGVAHLVQGEEDKLPAMQRIMAECRVSLDEVAFIGDDVPDLPCIQRVALGVAVQDAHPLVLRDANYTTFLPGGHGAVRELCDLIMQAKGVTASVIGKSQ
ncbi:3-deoxy-manno-octulosonate-8-phosphatase KdsC [Thalassotalea mangrovi]|uniref:3-deoxy-D-manno-octulosonate 8-phosphate phosphatase KdsC n=1 Tax=Thalassotalea mangrovi TaxID=2572245 RepID=A0A4U1BAL9_9GAMM|nr:3-deoxy-manno-octulosonate-8-phosphatase KdsC [Thalassotalea mangrovi]TKB47893.1 3-deoxy-manno-octulosonate-8-phosphatase KdsC [Thalassotalea mangrovi]